MIDQLIIGVSAIVGWEIARRVKAWRRVNRLRRWQAWRAEQGKRPDEGPYRNWRGGR